MLWLKLQHVACGILQMGHASMTALNHPIIHHEQSLTLNTVKLIFLFNEKIFPTLTYNAYPNYQIQSQDLWKWNILHLLHNCIDYLAFGIMLYTAWTFGYVQQACTEQQQFLLESIQHSLTTTTSMKWLLCLMKLSQQVLWQCWIWIWKGTTLLWWGIWQW